MSIEWTNEMTSGIDVIDHQNRQFINYLNDLEEIDERNSTAVLKVINDLINYTISHFSYEENLQNEAGYRFAVAHKKVHDEFVKRIIQYKDRQESGELIAKELHKMLCTWLTRHIQRDDRDYVIIVRESMAKKFTNRNSWFRRNMSIFSTS
jgi:hemerythrin